MNPHTKDTASSARAPRRRSAVLALLLIVVTAATVGAGAAAAKDRVRSKPPANHTRQWQWLHGREAVERLSECRSCHNKLSCRTCHLAEWPHPARYIEQHGVDARKREAKSCYLCHRATFCDPCHGGVHIPHPEGYVRTHTLSATSSEACTTCHLTAADCDPCHTKHAAHRSGGSTR